MTGCEAPCPAIFFIFVLLSVCYVQIFRLRTLIWNTLSLFSSFTVRQNSAPVNFSVQYCLILRNLISRFRSLVLFLGVMSDLLPFGHYVTIQYKYMK